MLTEARKGPRELTPHQRHWHARTTFTNIVHDRTTPLTQDRLRRGLFAVEQAALAVPTQTLSSTQMELTDLAKYAEQEAKRRGQPATAKLMELAETDIRDRFAIKRGLYPLVEVRTQLPQQEGGQVIYIPVYQATEVKRIFGPPSTEPIPLE